VSVDIVVEVVNQALFTVIKTAAPVLLISMVVGLVISIFQTVTSIQEQILTFVPKIIAVFLGLMIFGPWMMQNMVDFMTRLWSSFSLYIHR